jgi:hypothetical protein
MHGHWCENTCPTMHKDRRFADGIQSKPKVSSEIANRNAGEQPMNVVITFLVRYR